MSTCRQVLPAWGEVRLSDVTHAGVSEWVAELTASHLSPASVRYAHRVFALVLEHAVRDRRILANPAAGVRLPRTTTPPPVFLSHQQVHELADAAGGYRTLILTLAYTGLRWGEAAALRTNRVDLQGQRLTVDQATAEVRGRVIFGSPKSHQQRSVPFPRFLVPLLREQSTGKLASDLLFQGPHGGVLRNTNFRRRVFDRAAASAGLVGVTPHVLRHTAASLAVASGASVKAVQRMLGHASAAMTLDVYAGLFADDLDAVGASLDDAAAAVLRPEFCGLDADQTDLRASPAVDPGDHKGPLSCDDTWGRLRDSNPRPTHYECVALAS